MHGVISLNAKAVLKLSEEATDRSPFSFLSDEEYSKIKNYDKLFDLMNKISKYCGLVRKTKENNNPLKVTFSYPDQKHSNIVFIRTLRRGFKDFVTDNICVEIPNSELKSERDELFGVKELVKSWEEGLKWAVMEKIKDLFRRYKIKRL